MKITISSEDYEISPELARKLTEIFGELPVKKTETKEYRLIFSVEGKGSHLYDEEFVFTESTANKLSEAISALVDYVQDDTIENHERLMTFAWEARKSFQESQ